MRLPQRSAQFAIDQILIWLFYVGLPGGRCVIIQWNGTSFLHTRTKLMGQTRDTGTSLPRASAMCAVAQLEALVCTCYCTCLRAWAVSPCLTLLVGDVSKQLILELIRRKVKCDISIDAQANMPSICLQSSISPARCELPRLAISG